MKLGLGTQKRSRGFTIVEVMIVIAIAAFILLIVFLAVPALRKSARNNARQTDVKLLLARVQEQVSIFGRLPESCETGDTCFLSDVNLGHFEHSGSNIAWVYQSETVPGNLLNPESADDTSKVIITNYAVCDANNVTGDGAIRDNVVATYLIETMSGHDVACIQS